MKISSLITVGLLMFASQSALAGTKTLVEYGVVQESHIATVQRASHPLRTVAAGALGGVVGHQFGNGKGKTAMTVAGAAAGAGVSRYHQSTMPGVQQVEVTIKTDAGQVISVVQGYNSTLNFAKGEKVRILTSGQNTRVDKSL